jgi:hypothetical protein
LNGRRKTPPGLPSKCDPVTVAYSDTLPNEQYRVFEDGFGCTTARVVARRWHKALACRRLRLDDTCSVGNVTCEAIAGGSFDAVASARCTAPTHPTAAIELVHRRPCRPASHADDISLWAINVDCQIASAFPVAKLLPDKSDNGPCGDLYDLTRALTCTSVAGFTCTARPSYRSSFYEIDAQCLADQDRFEALELEWHLG